MAGHSKWANIQHRKGRQDEKRGKVWTRVIREIMVAARQGGGDLSANPRLRLAVEKAKAANMPADTIKRNIDKATGTYKGTGAGRDELLKRNGCGTETKPWDVGDKTFESSSCVEYQGCMQGYSVVWCQTTGHGHSNGAETGISTKGFWTFWSSLP